ncbi:major facilitator superfamily domain-containing protein [Xylaria sp. FL0933]|nr:major facilitator superfamily domain-containing protein [Xylaria sp. FL0933]
MCYITREHRQSNSKKNEPRAAWYGSAFFLTSGSFQAPWGKAYCYFDMKWTDLAKSPACTGIMGLNYCFASGLGPLVGGAITTGTIWRWRFYITLPMGTITVLIIASWKEKFLQANFVGAVLVLGSLISFSLATQYGGQTKPWNSGTVVELLLTVVVLVGIFAVWEWHAGERAMIVHRLLMQQRAGIGSAFAFLLAGSYCLTLYYLPIYFQSIDNGSPTNSGVDTLPLILASTVAVISAGLFITKTGHAIPLWLLYTLDIGTSSDKWMVFLNVGGGLLVNAAQSAFVNRLLIAIPGSAPGVDPSLVVATGTLAFRSTFSKDQLPGIPEAYMVGIKIAFAIALAAFWYLYSCEYSREVG